jgi:hypothetical protein
MATNPMTDFFGEVISSYSRAEAIEDGVLVNLSGSTFHFRERLGQPLNVVEEAGIKFPVAMTIAAFEKTVSEIDGELPAGQDISGRIWDVLTMFRLAARNGGQLIHFRVSVTNWVHVNGKAIHRTKQELVTLKAVCGPGDDAEPVITIMLPNED